MKLSVIIPMYNSSKTIADGLAGLENQTVMDFEVVVVDDGSTDISPQVVREFRQKSSLPIKLIHQSNSGTAKARNMGAQHAAGEVLVFLDSDCVPPPDWLESLTTPLQDGWAGCTCGYRVRNKESLIARYVDYEIAWRHRKVIGQSVNVFGGYALSLRKEAFTRAGGFDTTYTEANAEDFALGFKLRRMGYDVLFTDKTFVYHSHPSSLQRYLKQQYRRGYWRVKMYLENRDSIIRGDSYTGHEAQIQFLLSNLALLSLPLMLINPYLPLLGFGLLLLSNLPLSLWIFPREKKFLLLAPVLGSLRSLVGTIGAYVYVVQNLPRSLVRRPAR